MTMRWVLSIDNEDDDNANLDTMTSNGGGVFAGGCLMLDTVVACCCGTM
jgi:hypothetical protein